VCKAYFLNLVENTFLGITKQYCETADELAIFLKEWIKTTEDCPFNLYVACSVPAWHVVCHVCAGVPGKKNSVTYDCCPEPYVDITFTIHIRYL
jgi:hypothetical protein